MISRQYIAKITKTVENDGYLGCYGEGTGKGSQVYAAMTFLGKKTIYRYACPLKLHVLVLLTLYTLVSLLDY